jgi:class 3 adenylate cyclase
MGPDGPEEHWAAGQLEGKKEARELLATASLTKGEPISEGSLTAIPLAAGVFRAALVAEGGTAMEEEHASVLATLGSRGLEISALRVAAEGLRRDHLSLSRFLSPPMALSTRRQDYDRLFEPAQRPLSLMSLEVEGLAEEVDLVGPLRLFPVLDQYFSTIVDSVYENEGVFLAHSLEGVTAVFGAPLASGETTAADLAAASALRLIERLREMTDKWGVEGLPLHLRAKAGVSSGSAMVGAFGPTDRPLFSVIGPQLRLVRQLTQHAEPWTLVVDSSSRSLLSEHLSTRSVGAVEVRGLDYPVFAYVAELVKKS